MKAAIRKELKLMVFRLLTVQKSFSVVFICFYKARFFKIGTMQHSTSICWLANLLIGLDAT